MRFSSRVAAFCSAGLSVSAAAGPPVIYAVDTTGSRLVTLDPLTGAATFVASIVGGGTIGALAYDPAGDTLYASSTSLHQLFRLDYNSGTATLIGSYGLGTPFMHGLEWDGSTGTLYGTSYQQPELFRINTATGRPARWAPPASGPASRSVAWDTTRSTTRSTSPTQ